MPADLPDSLKADEEDRKTDHAPLVQVKENEEVAIVTATIETSLRQCDLTDTETESHEALSEWAEQSRGTQELIVAEEVISSVGEEVLMAVRQHGRMSTEKGLWLACESAGDSTSGRAHSPTAMLCFFLLVVNRA